ncbi:MAG: HEAT repeat domain-containing protein [Candidatus Thorarchaeota archaeon]|nr:HEAT repeat domain-containing protein [Candidatus Thorarchaeota archaeon]
MSETRRLLLEFETELLSSLAKKDKRVREELIRAFSDASEIVRERALIASIDLNDPTIVDDIAKALSDNEVDVRIAAAQALAWYHQPRTVPALLAGLKDSNTWVRSHCAVGLSKLMNGPIWARLKEDVINKFIASFPDMTNDEITLFMTDLGIHPDAIQQYLQWRKKDFDVEIDFSVVAEMESGPIILMGEGAEAETAVLSTHSGLALSPEVETILSELPRDMREKLPPEDLKRLTPETARELVDSLIGPTPSEKPKKKVKVRKVKRVRRVKKEPSKDELLAKLPPEVKASVSEDTLAMLSVEELEALLSTSVETEEEVVVEPETKRTRRKASSKAKKKESRKTTATTEVEKIPEDETERKKMLEQKYGKAKAELLSILPPDMLEGIPPEQIDEMDIDTLKDLTRALESH